MFRPTLAKLFWGFVLAAIITFAFVAVGEIAIFGDGPGHLSYYLLPLLAAPLFILLFRLFALIFNFNLVENDHTSVFYDYGAKYGPGGNLHGYAIILFIVCQFLWGYILACMLAYLWKKVFPPMNNGVLPPQT